MQRKDDNPRPPSIADAPELRPDHPGEEEVTPPSQVRAVSARPATQRVRPPTPPAPSGSTVSPALNDPRIGETLVGRYRLDKLVGKGGMGRVYRATQFPLNRPVAVKILNPEFQKKDPQFVRRFFLEAASAARLSHPNTITVFDYGEAESGELFIAMEYLKGRPLSRVIGAEGPFAAERVLHVAMQICRALREAHTKGIIHRDLKPGNILLLEEGDDADFVKVLDFGLVKLMHTDGEPVPDDPLTPEPVNELTKAGMFLGSPKYMSPEQIQGLNLDPRTDIYSLGVLMFHMATGKPPFTGGTSVEVIYKHVNQPVPSFASLGIDVPPEVEDVIGQCLAKHRDDRFASMNALLVRLKDVQRLVTGNSAVMDTAFDIDISELSNVQGRHTAYPTPVSTDLPAPGSLRPQTHPARASATPTSGSQVPREVAFAETGPMDDTGSGLLLRKGAKGSSMSRAAPWLAGGAFVVVLGVLAFVLARPHGGGGVEPTPGPSAGVVDDDPVEAPPKPVGVRVTFSSEPAGAVVFDEHGLSLGRTPLSTTLPPTRGSGSSQFLFKLDGFKEENRGLRLEGDEVELSVKMSPTAVEAPPPAGGDPEDDDAYKENPY
ncbi:MAG: protein kinase [Myxococcales bacterium]|nr:protein kinase [Myxococcales bacterium]MCB9650383.1 protein kinase [Deltaproteobacteria bacterium]